MSKYYPKPEGNWQIIEPLDHTRIRGFLTGKPMTGPPYELLSKMVRKKARHQSIIPGML